MDEGVHTLHALKFLQLPLGMLVIWLCWKRLQRAGNCGCVLVLGDFGRSPRMQYHTISLSQHLEHVDVLAYLEATPLLAIVENPKIRLHGIKVLPPLPKGLGVFALPYKVAKVLYQTFQLVVQLLFVLRKPRFILVQNPPSIPTLMVGSLAKIVLGTDLIVDWHNYGYSILALSHNPRGLLVRLAHWLEHTFGSFGTSHLCVTEAMKNDLALNWEISANVLHDKPPECFHRRTVSELHHLFSRIAVNAPEVTRGFGSTRNANVGADETLLTCLNTEGQPTLKLKRPALIVSSTSWTEDEDFHVLMSALALYDQAAASNKSLPDVLCLITGKGPMRDYYMDKVSRLQLTAVKIVSVWLTAEDYPVLLGCADLGISLHTSSSGLDLPMKVVDMFGSGLPVCAIKFNW